MDEKEKSKKKSVSGGATANKKAGAGATKKKEKTAKLVVSAEFDGDTGTMTVKSEGNLTKAGRLERMEEYSKLGSAIFNSLCKGAVEKFLPMDCQRVLLAIVDTGLKVFAEQEGIGVSVEKFAENLIAFNTKGKCVADDEDEDEDDCCDDEEDDDEEDMEEDREKHILSKIAKLLGVDLD